MIAASNTPIGLLLFTVFSSILQVVLVCIAGYILAKCDILDKRTRKQINHINVALFTPALLFSKIALFLSPETLRELWIAPLFFALVSVVSMMVAFSLGWMFKLKRSQRNFAMAASMFMNTNSLPVALMQSLVVAIPSLRWGDDDTTGAMTGRAFTYLVVYSSLSMMLRWSLGVQLLSIPDDPELETPLDERSPLLGGISNEVRPSTSTLMGDESISTVTPHLRVPRRRTTFYKSFPNSPTRERATLPPTESSPPSPHAVSDEEDSDTEALPMHNTGHGSSGLLRRMGRHIHYYWVAINDFMSMPLWATLASLIVACVPPVQNILDKHMQPLKGALAAAGNCSIPLTLVVLGAYFYVPPKEDGGGAIASMSTSRSVDSLADSFKDLIFFKRSTRGRAARPSAEPVTPGETKSVAIAVVSRMVITPLLLLPLMAASTKFDWHKALEDPVFVVANVLVLSSPPALTLAQITQVASGDAFERLISRTLFWSYCIVTPPATIVYVVIGLIFTKL